MTSWDIELSNDSKMSNIYAGPTKTLNKPLFTVLRLYYTYQIGKCKVFAFFIRKRTLTGLIRSDNALNLEIWDKDFAIYATR